MLHCVNRVVQWVLFLSNSWISKTKRIILNNVEDHILSFANVVPNIIIGSDYNLNFEYDLDFLSNCHKLLT